MQSGGFGICCGTTLAKSNMRGKQICDGKKIELCGRTEEGPGVLLLFQSTDRHQRVSAHQIGRARQLKGNFKSGTRRSRCLLDFIV